MNFLNDPNIVRLLAVSSEEEPYCMIFEFMCNGDLSEYLRNSQPLKEDEINENIDENKSKSISKLGQHESVSVTSLFLLRSEEKLRFLKRLNRLVLNFKKTRFVHILNWYICKIWFTNWLFDSLTLYWFALLVNECKPVFRLKKISKDLYNAYICGSQMLWAKPSAELSLNVHFSFFTVKYRTSLRSWKV